MRDLLRLALLHRLLESDLTLGIEQIFGHLFTVDESRLGGRDVQGHIMERLGGGAIRTLHHDTNLAAHVDVRSEGVARSRFDQRRPVEDDVLTNHRHLQRHRLFNRVFRVTRKGLRLQLVGGLRAGFKDLVDQGIPEIAEIIELGHRLGFAVELEDGLLRVIACDRHHSIIRRSSGLLRRRREALGSQKFDRLIEVTAGLGERLLAVHHPGAGSVPELFDRLCCDRHLFHLSLDDGARNCVRLAPRKTQFDARLLLRGRLFGCFLGLHRRRWSFAFFNSRFFRFLFHLGIGLHGLRFGGLGRLLFRRLLCRSVLDGVSRGWLFRHGLLDKRSLNGLSSRLFGCRRTLLLGHALRLSRQPARGPSP